MKRSLLLILFLFPVVEGFSQRFVPRIGLTTSTISFSYPDMDDRTKIGFVLGFGFETAPKNGFFMQPEVSVARKGINFRYHDELNVDLALYYLDILVPIKFKFNPNKSGDRFYLLGGPALGVGLGGRYKTSENKNSVKFKSYEGPDHKYLAYVDNRLDFGAQLGAGIEMLEGFIVEVRYTHGLTNIYTAKNRHDSTWSVNLIENSKNRVWQLSLGYFLKRKKP